MDQFRVALAQCVPKLFDKEANLAKAEEYIDLAVSGAHAILFPELYLTGYADRSSKWLKPSMTKCQGWLTCSRHQISVIMGMPNPVG
jgi:predicted amidohydrolase